MEKQPFDPSQPLGVAKWERFCAFIIARQSAEDAYELAGYRADRRSALCLRARPEVDARIKWLMAQKSKAAPNAKTKIGQAQLTKQFVVDGLAEIVVVCLGRRDAANGKRIYNPQAANHALELLGKEFGMFKGTGAPIDDPYDLTGIDPRGVFDNERLKRLFLAEERRNGGKQPGAK